MDRQVSPLEKYIIGRTIGRGAFSRVKAAWCTHKRELIAIKIIYKQATEERFVQKEMDILLKLQHRHIVRTYEVNNDNKDHCFLFQELCENGSLMDYREARRYLLDQESRFIFKQLCGAVSYCHSHDIVHRDIKCENIFFDKHMNVKMGDFGMAIDKSSQTPPSSCGSLAYADPELRRRPYRDTFNWKKTDIWSLGVVLYAMLCGYLPFAGDLPTLSNYQNIKYPKHVTLVSRLYTQQILNIEQAERPDITELESSDWMQLCSLRPRPLSSSPKYSTKNALSLTRSRNTIHTSSTY